MASNCPLPTTRLRQICSDACTTALGPATLYDHSQTATWNNLIINAVLQRLIAESQQLSSTDDEPSSSSSSQQQYKWIVNTTIIQHLSDPRPAPTSSSAAGSADSAAAAKPVKVGRRGMHSASGAFWNNEKDGMWSYKHDPVNAGGGGGSAGAGAATAADEQRRGMDVVVSVMWVAV